VERATDPDGKEQHMGAVIKTVNLTKRYGTLVALSNLNLEIEEGDCYGFIGPNGAGKVDHDQDSGDAAGANRRVGARVGPRSREAGERASTFDWLRVRWRPRPL